MGSNNEVNRRLHSVAEGQAGFFTAQQAKNAGFSEKSHVPNVREGHWARRSRGIYRLAPVSSGAAAGADALAFVAHGPGGAGTGCLSSFYRFGALCYATDKAVGCGTAATGGTAGVEESVSDG